VPKTRRYLPLALTMRNAKAQFSAIKQATLDAAEKHKRLIQAHADKQKAAVDREVARAFPGVVMPKRSTVDRSKWKKSSSSPPSSGRARAATPARRSGVRHCSECGRKGHDLRNCTQKKLDKKEGAA
jgi:hypothetical protein